MSLKISDKKKEWLEKYADTETLEKFGALLKELSEASEGMLSKNVDPKGSEGDQMQQNVDQQTETSTLVDSNTGALPPPTELTPDVTKEVTHDNQEQQTDNSQTSDNSDNLNTSDTQGLSDKMPDVQKEKVVEFIKSTAVSAAGLSDLLKQYTWEVVNPMYEAMYKIEETMFAMERRCVELEMTLKTVLESLSKEAKPQPEAKPALPVVEQSASTSYVNVYDLPHEALVTIVKEALSVRKERSPFQSPVTESNPLATTAPKQLMSEQDKPTLVKGLLSGI